MCGVVSESPALNKRSRIRVSFALQTESVRECTPALRIAPGYAHIKVRPVQKKNLPPPILDTRQEAHRIEVRFECALGR